MKFEEVQNTPTEELSPDELRISELLGGLKRVEAPNNFEFGVRSKIAARQTELPRRSVPVWAFGGIAAVLVAVIGMFFIVNSLQTSGPVGGTVAEVRTSERDVPATEQPESVRADSFAPAEEVLESAEQARPSDFIQTQPAVGRTRPAPVRRTARRGTPVAVPTPAGGSFDTAVEASNPIMPPGFDNSSPTASERSTRGVAAIQLLSALGVDAAAVGNSIVVRSVKENSVAARSGLLAGDTIESIGGTAVAPKSQISGAVRSVTVTRSGARIRIDLRP